MWFSHFSERMLTKLSDEPTFATKFSTDSTLIASSFQDGGVKIISTEFLTTLYSFQSDPQAKKDKKTCFPVTGLSWKNNEDFKVLIGSMCDGSIMRWKTSMNNSCEKVTLNPLNQYQCIDYSGDGKRFVVAGLLP